MTNEKLNVLGEKLNEYWNEIERIKDKAIISILGHYDLSIEYVIAHSDKFKLIEEPQYKLDKIIINGAIIQDSTILGSYSVHSYWSDKQFHNAAAYIIGDDPTNIFDLSTITEDL
jgi:hypothetical protein